MGGSAFLPQEKPLYSGFTVAEMLKFGRVLNRAWTTNENTCDWLIAFNGVRVQVSGDIDNCRAPHPVRIGVRRGLGRAPRRCGRRQPVGTPGHFAGHRLHPLESTVD